MWYNYKVKQHGLPSDRIFVILPFARSGTVLLDNFAVSQSGLSRARRFTEGIVSATYSDLDVANAEIQRLRSELSGTDAAAGILEECCEALEAQRDNALAFAREFLEWAAAHSSIFVWYRDRNDPLSSDPGWISLVEMASACIPAPESAP